MLLRGVRIVRKTVIAAAFMGLLILVTGGSEKVLAETASREYTAGGSSVVSQAVLTASEKMTGNGAAKNPIVLVEGVPTGDLWDEVLSGIGSAHGTEASNGANGLTMYVKDNDGYTGTDDVFIDRTLNIYTYGMKFTSETRGVGDNGEVRFYTSDKDVALVTKLGRVLALTPGECVLTAISEDGSTHTMKVVISDKPATNRQVALTFDDGPCWLGDSLMDFLDEMNVKVTFFYEGVNIWGNEDNAIRAYNSGHEIGNHTWNHECLSLISPEKIREDVEKGNEAIYNAIGTYPTLLRPPYGSYNQKVKDNVNMPMVTWNIDTEDWDHLNAEKTRQAVVEGAQDGYIILVHEIHPTTIEGVQPAIRQLIEEGVEFVTVTQILTRNGEELQPGMIYWRADRDPR